MNRLRFLNIRYLRYLAHLNLKRVGMMTLSYAIVLRRIFTKRAAWSSRIVTVVLPHPLGIGDLSMLSVLFPALSQFSLNVVSTHEEIFEGGPHWEVCGEVAKLYEVVRRHAESGALIIIPKVSMRSLLFLLTSSRYHVVAELGGNLALGVKPKEVFRLRPDESYSARALRLVADLIGGDSSSYLGERLQLKTEEVSPSIRQFLELQQGRAIYLLAPAVSWEARRWSVERWGKLIEWLVDVTQGSVIILGSKPERSFGDEIISKVRRADHIYNSMGLTKLTELRPLLSSAHTLFSLDNGLMHLGSASGIRTVAIFGCTPYQYRLDGYPKTRAVHSYDSCHLAPCYQDYLEVVCPYHYQCIREVTVEQVIQAFEKSSDCNYRSLAIAG